MNLTALAQERPWSSGPIQRVETLSDGYRLNGHDGWTIFCPRVDGLPNPVVGETLDLYGDGLGRPVRGIVVAGRPYRYETPEEMKARFEQEAATARAEREAKFDASREETDLRIEALPEPFRARLYRFQMQGGRKFRTDFESYELFTCEQAVLIAATVPPADLAAFREMTWEAQLAAVPGLSEGHSGNTFGCAVLLARVFLESPERLQDVHGAMAPLVGCAEYGCHVEGQPR